MAVCSNILGTLGAILRPSHRRIRATYEDSDYEDVGDDDVLHNSTGKNGFVEVYTDGEIKEYE